MTRRLTARRMRVGCTAASPSGVASAQPRACTAGGGSEPRPSPCMACTYLRAARDQRTCSSSPPSRSGLLARITCTCG